ncbi:EI24 domain-containing protein [Gymnodinialimonas ceratoperidinii]|uniref:EI24 domain-containing protein n=1 Tax=Gymnodinialimonas ceratoperidinii TaxID=2856823 RepID=A0A8F6TXW3_9RHOB|nr:EI24 domain-containing protein [Gymnodinialimonas ceratoperidinii]QXT40932.1 EI24 domain-containing protein [Gymnodinialimonas ceratoperidinii]
MIINAFLKALGQLTDSRFLGVLGLGVGLTIGLLIAFYAAFVLFIGWMLPESFALPWIGEITWVDNALAVAGIPLMLLLSIFLMVPVASAFMGIFIDRVAGAVEDRHYPGLPPARGLSIGEALVDVAKFLAVLVGVNLVALILYLLFAPLAPLLFWVVNGVLLGREYGQMVALRHESAAGAAAFRKRHRPTLFAAGVLMTVPLTIPVVNLLVPILGAATFTHLYHMLNGTRARPSRSG